VSSLHLIESDTINYTYKSTHREELNALYAQRGMADDILIVKDGYLTDTSIANIALYDGHTWFTPAHPLLQGTKRAELLNDQFWLKRWVNWKPTLLLVNLP
jgi:4-amino-4-deoxychorismate lyase